MSLITIRDPKLDPAPGDAIGVGDHQLYTVRSAEAGEVHYELLELGHRHTKRMPLSAWRELMRQGLISRVGSGIANA